MMTPPSLRDMEYFLEVADAGSISRAAERLGLSQPSLTLAVQRLEESVGAPLLLRSKSGVSLTVCGRRMVERAGHLCDDWRRLRDYVMASQQSVAGSYVLGCHTAVAAYTLPHCLPALMHAYPALHLKLAHDLSRKIVEATVSLRVDLGIVINPVRHPDLVIRPICDDQVTFWRASDDAVTTAEDVLLCDPELMQTQSLMRALEPTGRAFSRTLESSSLEVIATLTARGAGIGVLPTRVAEQHQLERVPGAPLYQDALCVVFRVENKGVPAIAAIAQTLVGALTDDRLRSGSGDGAGAAPLGT
ncbi:MAG TPA: LysR family transcriptional regulator [Myxococcota bacterium]|nr:LysR family transcriptional regulator [Myxococcota bacterium]